MKLIIKKIYSDYGEGVSTLKKKKVVNSLITHMYDLRIWEIEAGGLLQIQGQSRIQHETPFQNTKKKKL